MRSCNAPHVELSEAAAGKGDQRVILAAAGVRPRFDPPTFCTIPRGYACRPHNAPDTGSRNGVELAGPFPQPVSEEGEYIDLQAASA